MNSGSPATGTFVNISREERLPIRTHANTNEKSGLSSSEKLGSDKIIRKSRKQPIRVVAWDVRTLYHSGKFDNLILGAKHL